MEQIIKIRKKVGGKVVESLISSKDILIEKSNTKHDGTKLSDLIHYLQGSSTISNQALMIGKGNKISNIPQHIVTGQDPDDMSRLILTKGIDFPLTNLENDRKYMYHIYVLGPAGIAEYWGGFIEDLSLDDDHIIIKMDRTNFVLSNYPAICLCQINDTDGNWYGTILEDTDVSGASSIGRETEVFNNGFTFGTQTKAFGIDTFAGGLLSSAEGPGALSIGYSTRSFGAFTASFNKKTVAYNDYSFATGNRGTAFGERSFISGQSGVNAILDLGVNMNMTKEEIFELWKNHRFGNQPFSMAFGSSTHVSGENNFAGGRNDHVSGGYCGSMGQNSILHGYDILSDGEGNAIFGYKHNIVGDTNLAGGEGNTMVGRYNILGGSYNIITGDNSGCFGYNNVIKGKCGYAFGGHLEVSEFQVVFGHYNKPSEDDAIQFGWGEKDNPENLFELKKTGDAWFKGDITVGQKREEVLTMSTLLSIAGNYKKNDLVGGITSEITPTLLYDTVFDEYVITIDDAEYARASAGESIRVATEILNASNTRIIFYNAGEEVIRTIPKAGPLSNGLLFVE